MQTKLNNQEIAILLIIGGAIGRYRIWEIGFWKEVFRPWTHRWSHTEYDQ